MITKYKTSRNSLKIEKVEVVRETEKSVFLIAWSGKERREAKHSSWDVYHDSWEAAHAYIVENLKFKLSEAVSRLNAAEFELSKAIAMAQEPQQ